MLTQCPHCLTLFRVGPEHLKAASGQVRCCRCHKVFNALQSLQESPTPFSHYSSSLLVQEEPELQLDADTDIETDAESPRENLDNGERHDFHESPTDSDFEPLLPGLQANEPHEALLGDILEKNDGLDPEPDYFADSSESQMSELLDRDSSSLLLPDDEEAGQQQSEPGNIVTFAPTAEKPPSEEAKPEPPADQEIGLKESILTDDTLDEELGRPEYDSVPAFRTEPEPLVEAVAGNDLAINFEAEKTDKPALRISPLWLIGSLLLVVPLAAQLAWQFRHDLIQNTTGRETLNLICKIAGCEVPERRALDHIVIQGRNLSSHPNKPDVLSLQLSMVNTAAFDQPFPQLTLSLYNDVGNLIARRTFAPDNYLSTRYEPLNLMPKGEPILIEMELVDPGKEVTGFSFDFY